MISKRSYYSPDIAAEYCRRSAQGLPLPVHPSSQSDIHCDGNDGLNHRRGPASEADGKHTVGHTRRRIAVACQRCRKRKIKCSGDLGNGQGCSNCRSAGTPPSMCTFLRVNSRECEAYFSLRGPQAGGRYNPYPPNQSTATRGPPMQQFQPNNGPSTACINPSSGYDCYHGPYGQGITRASYPAYPVSYEDEIYNGQSPAYMPPTNNDSMLSTNSNFGPPPSPRNWEVLSHSGRSRNCLYPDQNSSNSMSLPNGSFTGSSIPFTPNTNEITSALSSNGNITTSSTSLDRTLPIPTMGRTQQPALVIAGSNVLDGLSMNNVGYRNSIPWAGSEVTSGGSNPSDRVVSVSFGSSVDSSGCSTESSAAPQEDASFTYHRTSRASRRVPSKATSLISDSGRSETVRKANDGARENRTRTCSHESSPSPDSPTAEAYGYSGDTVVGRRSTRGSASSSTLSNGQEYTRLRPQPRPQPPSNPELYRSPQQDSAECQSRIAHRTSIASLSSPAQH